MSTTQLFNKHSLEVKKSDMERFIKAVAEELEVDRIDLYRAIFSTIKELSTALEAPAEGCCIHEYTRNTVSHDKGDICGEKICKASTEYCSKHHSQHKTKELKEQLSGITSSKKEQPVTVKCCYVLTKNANEGIECGVANRRNAHPMAIAAGINMCKSHYEAELVRRAKNAASSSSSSTQKKAEVKSKATKKKVVEEDIYEDEE